MSEADLPLFDHLNVLDDPQAHGAAFNMALDEALLGGLTVPLLRIYRWERPAVSCGFFTPWQPVCERYPERDLVRRWTGGGVVEHGADVTFSLLVPRSHSLSNGQAGESYRVIHGALRAALMRLGWRSAQLAGDDVAPPPDVAANPCFTSPVRDDVLAEGRKIGGGAQRRTRDGLLHQGSVLAPADMPLDATKLAAVLPTVFAAQFTPRPLRHEDERLAQDLARTKYSTDAWSRRV